MNSKYMLIDTDSILSTTQLGWWKHNKEIYLYPKIWNDLHKLDILYYGLDENRIITKDKLEEKLTELSIEGKGVMIITGDNSKNKNMFRNLAAKINKNNPNTNNRMIFGDELLYETPLASLEDPTTTWYCNEATGEDVEEAYNDFCKKYFKY
jgi:hypothetical protein